MVSASPGPRTSTFTCRAEFERKTAAIVSSVPFAEIAIISGAGLESVPAAVADREKLFALPDVRGAWALFEPAHGNKCARCWMILNEVGRNKPHADLCNRCSAAVP